MKKLILGIFVFVCFCFVATTFSSCKTGYGCPAEEAYEKSKEKPLSTKRGKSKLFKNN